MRSGREKAVGARRAQIDPGRAASTTLDPMTAPVVVIEIAEPDRTSPFVATLLEACSKASLAGPCALAETSGADDAPALAILQWQDDHRIAHLDVGLRRSD